MSTSVVLTILAAIVVAATVMVFRANHAAYWRISGYAVNVAALKALTFAVVMSGAMLLAWWLPGLFLKSATWRACVAVVLYSVLMRAIGSPVMAVVRRLIHRRYFLDDIG
jgi:hypothetical protein